MKSNLLIIIYGLIVTMSVMYATQPLQPLLATKFEVTITEASLFTAVILFFLAVAPIIYGYILEKVCAKKMLINASIVLLITNIFLGLSNSYELFLFFRVCEALVIPAILTSLMSILANIDKDNIKFNMSIYVAGTVFGGLVGRIFSGFIATTFSYEYVFYSLSVAIFISILLIKKLNFNGEANIIKPKISDVLNILKDRRFVIVYFVMFCIFFVFSGVLNVLPFRAKELSSEFSEFQIALLYLGYGMGILVSLNSKKIVNFFKGEINTILYATIFFIFTISSLFIEDILYLFLLLFLVCIGMFTAHTVSTQLANSMQKSQKSLTSGMYLTFYYLGGATGSLVPSMIYKAFNWNIMLIVFVILLLVVALVVALNKDLFKTL
ncbi:MFS transporter [Aliarcobacter skirrowii]|uniref:MFS transporter n=1 Tax=Aliarcobacter skirrowii TaxID=28200 RepID=UPI0021B2B97F|nr:MFS transporter [Aliarcobacter skirrowii]MCT7446220.1 MFS transporter [Aliarcobacter skirrowii]MDX3959648.1 MFS transporter [Aliarcobacter skirrowii]MDX4034943.1 MFS transporter [Aliarcobacter skirrowii]MDX4038181.1 MFS transporter [Aliarcobacter skirrowii]MDX4063386.1 MFS transporter [Aliarcobacter skirrowii]